MRRRLLANLIGATVGYDEDAINLFDKMDLAGSVPSSDFQDIINNTIRNLKGLGTQGSAVILPILDKLDFYGAENTTQSLVSWRGNNPSLLGSPTFVAKSGWLPIGSGSHTIWSNFTPSVNGVNYTQNMCSFGVWVGANPGTAYFMGTLGTHKSAVRTVTTNNDNYCNSASFGLANFGTPQTEGLFWINRASSSVFKTIKNDVVISSPSVASSGLPTWNLAVAGTSNSPTTVSNILTLTNPIKMCWAGGNLEPYRTQFYNTISQHVSEVAAL